MHRPVKSLSCGVNNSLHNRASYQSHIYSNERNNGQISRNECDGAKCSIVGMVSYLTCFNDSGIVGSHCLLGMDGFRSGESISWAIMLDKSCSFSKEIRFCYDASAMQTWILIVSCNE